MGEVNKTLVRGLNCWRRRGARRIRRLDRKKATNKSVAKNSSCEKRRGKKTPVIMRNFGSQRSGLLRFSPYPRRELYQSCLDKPPSQSPIRCKMYLVLERVNFRPCQTSFGQVLIPVLRSWSLLIPLFPYTSQVHLIWGTFEPFRPHARNLCHVELC